MNSPRFRLALAAGLVAVAGTSQAAVMSPPVDSSGNLTAVDTTTGGAPAPYRFIVNPTTYPTPAIFYDASAGPQNPANIATLVSAAFGAMGNIQLVDACDSLGGSCAGRAANPETFVVNTSAPFDYLAIHFGGGELFFHWAQPISSATLMALDGFPGGLGNYRTFLSTPLPGAMALFLGALGLLGASRRGARRKLPPMA